MNDRTPADAPQCVGPNSLYNLLEKVYIVTPIVLGLCTIIFCLLVRKLYIEFGWAVFHLVHASPEMKREWTVVQAI